MSTRHRKLERRTLGRTQVEVSVVSAGGFLGMLFDPQQNRGGEWGTTVTDRGLREEAAAAAMHRGIELGVNYFDTAPLYAEGEVERLLGVAIRTLSSNERSDLVISTKVGQAPDGSREYSAATARRSLEASLGKLDLERVGIAFVHDPASDDHLDQMFGPGGAVEELERARGEGLVQAIGIGVRNQKFLRRAIESGRIDAILAPYDYTPIRSTSGPIFALAAQHGVGVVSGSPYMAGLLAGIDPAVAAAKRVDIIGPDLERAQKIWQWAQDRGVDVGSVAVQFQLRNPDVTTSLVGPRDVDEIEANVRHATADLPDDIWDDLEVLVGTLGAPSPGGEADV